MLRARSFTDKNHENPYGTHARNCSENEHQETADRISPRRICVAVHFVTSRSRGRFKRPQARSSSHARTAIKRKRRADARLASNTVSRPGNLQTSPFSRPGWPTLIDPPPRPSDPTPRQWDAGTSALLGRWSLSQWARLALFWAIRKSFRQPKNFFVAAGCGSRYLG
jgi:hypothetical protein